MKSEKSKLVSIILPVYNGSVFIKEVIDSILSQTYKNFELLILDDCSTDDSFEIINQYYDQRIKIFRNKKNIGYVKGLNFLFKESKGEYVFRNDQDDLLVETRIEKQVKLLNDNPEVGICGTQIQTIGYTNRKIFFPVDDLDIKTLQIFSSGFHHPTVAFRKSLFKNSNESIYEESFMPAEDYRLWTKMARQTQFLNTKDALLYYRTHENNFSSKKKEIQRQNNLKIRADYLKDYFGISIKMNTNLVINKLIYNEYVDENDLRQLRIFFRYTLKICANKPEFQSLRNIFSFYWLKACLLNFRGKKNLKKFKTYFCRGGFTIKFLLNPYLRKKLLRI